MIRRLAVLLLLPVLSPVLSAAPALAETAATGATVPKPGLKSAPAADAGRAGTMKASNQAEMLKAQKAAAARDKAWDARTRNSMTSICKGC